MSIIKKLYYKIRKPKSLKDELIERGLTIGKNLECYSWEGIDSNWPWLITIGDNVTISSNVNILAHDSSTNKVGCHTKIGLVSIGNNVFVGAKSLILCNVHIGSNVIIGGGSIVTHNIPDNCVVAGNPARIICSIDDKRTKEEKLLESHHYYNELQWYEWKYTDKEHREYMRKKLEENDGIGYV